MPAGPSLSLAEAGAMLAPAEGLARAVLALKRRRGTITPALRKRIGDRDGWVCRNCGQPIDPELTWLQPDRVAIVAHEEHLAAAWNPIDEAEILAWIGDDVDRAGVIWAWSLGTTWKERSTHTPKRERKHWSEEFWRSLRAVSGQRSLHNNEVGTIEHLIPVAVGGGNDDANLAIAHKRCNTDTGVPGASNAMLLAAPRNARDLLGDLERLRDAREIEPKWTIKCVDGLLAAADVLRVDNSVIRTQVRAALAAYAAHYKELWGARRDCIERVRAHAWETSGESDLEREIEIIDAKLATLKQAAAIGRWQHKRAALTAQLAKLQEQRASIRDTLEKLSGLSGHAYDAAWWRARQEELQHISRAGELSPQFEANAAL